MIIARSRSFSTCAGLLAMCVFSSAAQPPVVLQPYPQRVRTFYKTDDGGIPKELPSKSKPLPQGDVSALAVASDGAVWLGFHNGLVRYQAQAPDRDKRQYFAGKRYLPDDDVLALLADSNGGVWVRTGAGISHIEFKPMTLEVKAAMFEDRVSKRHDRYGLVASSRLDRPGDLGSNQPEPTDNDGLWTSMYAAGECFRYATTKSPDALSRATKSIEAVLFLTPVTGIPGYPARSFVKRGDADADSAAWHDSSDGRYRWKGDTSSDELVGHFFLYGIAFDLLPDGGLKKKVAATARAIADHILNHHYYLVGETGQPTTWGRWSEEYFKSKEGYPDAPLNALELLSFLKVTAHVTGDSKYQKEYLHVANDLGYAALTTMYLQRWEELNYSDEELFMLPLYSLMQYEKDPALRSLYNDALEQWWQNEQREDCPLWTFIYALARPDRNTDLSGAVWTLNRIPMDLVEWKVVNSTRHDLKIDESLDRSGKRQTEVLLPPDERPVRKWNSNPFVVDGGNGGRNEDDGAFFLLPYWLGRYHRLIQESRSGY